MQQPDGHECIVYFPIVPVSHETDWELDLKYLETLDCLLVCLSINVLLMGTMSVFTHMFAWALCVYQFVSMYTCIVCMRVYARVVREHKGKIRVYGSVLCVTPWGMSRHHPPSRIFVILFLLLSTEWAEQDVEEADMPWCGADGAGVIAQT